MEKSRDITQGQKIQSTMRPCGMCDYEYDMVYLAINLHDSAGETYRRNNLSRGSYDENPTGLLASLATEL